MRLTTISVQLSIYLDFTVKDSPSRPHTAVSDPVSPHHCGRQETGPSVETSELASRLILLIQISSHGNCRIDWTTKACRKTLQHSIIHTDRHNAIPLLSLSLQSPPPPPSLLTPVSFSLYLFLYWKDQWGQKSGADKHAGVCVCVCYLKVEEFFYILCLSLLFVYRPSLFKFPLFAYFNIYISVAWYLGEIVLIPLLCIKKW